MNNEIWKDVIGYEGLYKVSNMGRIKNVPKINQCGKGKYQRPEIIRKQRVFKPKKSNVSYCLVGLSKDSKIKYHLVHRLVALAFIENTNNKEYVNHINGNGLDNRVDNLEWCTNQENQEYALKTLRHIKTKPIVAKSKTTEQVFHFGSVTDGARWLLSTGKTKDQTCLTGIIKCCKHTIKSYQGYVWDYE